MRVLVVGLGVTGEAVALHAAERGWQATVVEDWPGGEQYAERLARVRQSGASVVERRDEVELAMLVKEADLIVPSPGVAVAHPVFGLAVQAGTPVVSELELGARVAPMLIAAVTGTNGKTTVTTLTTQMLGALGLRVAAVGNIGRPLCAAVADDVDCVVAEVSSFQLRYTDTFRPAVAVLLNIAADHLDWHPSTGDYVAAKAKVFERQTVEDALVASLDDAIVRQVARSARSEVMWFTVCDAPGGGPAFHAARGFLRSPEGLPLVAVDRLRRCLAHDVSNALAAVAASTLVARRLDRDVPPEALGEVLASFEGLPHRITLVGESGGVRFYDDSKATNPHATVSALRNFQSVVLVAGGRNRSRALDVLRDEAERVHALVAMGEAADDVAAVFEGLCPIHRVSSMAEAVRIATGVARPGDAVILSPACASLDAYPSYAARGDDFTSHVQRLLAERAGDRDGAGDDGP